MKRIKTLITEYYEHHKDKLISFEKISRRSPSGYPEHAYLCDVETANRKGTEIVYTIVSENYDSHNELYVSEDAFSFDKDELKLSWEHEWDDWEE